MMRSKEVQVLGGSSGPSGLAQLDSAPGARPLGTEMAMPVRATAVQSRAAYATLGLLAMRHCRRSSEP